MGALDGLIVRAMAEHPAWLDERVLSKLAGYPSPLGCWRWPAARAGEYGRVRLPRATAAAVAAVHRVVWLAQVGPIAEGMVLDHDGPNGCGNRACANPAHLEVVTNARNVAVTGRSFAARNAAKTHCEQGHPLAGDNLTPNGTARGYRQCLTCTQERERARTSAVRAAAAALGVSRDAYVRRFGKSRETAERIAMEARHA